MAGISSFLGSGKTGNARRALPDLETFLEAEVAQGEASESKLTFDGLRYRRQLLARA
ncbi:hypothetical protein [Bradyrhizobium sp. USDA 4473]